MAKGDPKTRPKDKTETPFRKFERLAGKIVRVPKDQARDKKPTQ
jgi:hypothetical protein